MIRGRRTGRVALSLLACSAALGAGSLALREHRDGGTAATWRRHEVQQARNESGFAFVATLPHGAPSEHEGLAAAAVFENGAPIGSPAEHEEIRKRGGGRFSFWRGTLYFSASDGSDPRTNGRRYEVGWPSPLLPLLERALRWGGWLGLGATGLLLACMLLGRTGARLWRPATRRWLARLSLVPASLLVALGGAELFLRFRYPFADNTWPSRFEERVGFLFEPGGVVRQTNLFDFCVEQRANSLGFLDREPTPRRAGVPRIVVLGDSFVEAVQVPIARKFHVLLEERLAARGIVAGTAAFGFSGCGQANELAFYEQFAACRPGDLVIVLVVNNDVANNSPLLEAVRNGWHPRHLPRLFFARDGDAFVRLPIDPRWSEHLLPAPPAPPSAPESSWAWSRLYRWVAATRQWIDRAAITAYAQATEHRIDVLRQDPDHGPLLAGWRFPADLDVDGMTSVVDPPPAFREAIALTEHAFAELARHAAADGARLLVVASHALGDSPGATADRVALPHGLLSVLAPICDRLGAPLLDLHEAFAAAGVLGKVTFVRDSHWNELGHASAAAAIDAWLQAHPEYLGSR